MWMATTSIWRSNAVMYVTVPYNKVLFSILYFLTSQSEVDFGMAYVFPVFNPHISEPHYEIFI
jgi:hypothetical protein